MKQVLIFVIGAAVGSVVTWKVLEAKCEQRIQDEVNELREFYKNRYYGPQQGSDSIEHDTEESAPKEPSQQTNYADMTGAYKNSDEEVTTYMNDTYVIPPEEYGEEDGYHLHSLVYYADHILVDDHDDIVENAEGLIGFDSLSHFGEYESDSVFVRNDRMKCYYEILKDERTYSEAMSTKPYHRED